MRNKPNQPAFKNPTEVEWNNKLTPQNVAYFFANTRNKLKKKQQQNRKKN